MGATRGRGGLHRSWWLAAHGAPSRSYEALRWALVKLNLLLKWCDGPLIDVSKRLGYHQGLCWSPSAFFLSFGLGTEGWHLRLSPAAKEKSPTVPEKASCNTNFDFEAQIGRCQIQTPSPPQQGEACSRKLNTPVIYEPVLYFLWFIFHESSSASCLHVWSLIPLCFVRSVIPVARLQIRRIITHLYPPSRSSIPKTEAVALVGNLGPVRALFMAAHPRTSSEWNSCEGPVRWSLLEWLMRFRLPRFSVLRVGVTTNKMRARLLEDFQRRAEKMWVGCPECNLWAEELPEV